MIVRARRVRPYQAPWGSRRSAGTAASSAAEDTGSSSPSSRARQRFAASTVMSTSAGVTVALRGAARRPRGRAAAQPQIRPRIGGIARRTAPPRRNGSGPSRARARHPRRSRTFRSPRRRSAPTASAPPPFRTARRRRGVTSARGSRTGWSSSLGLLGLRPTSRLRAVVSVRARSPPCPCRGSVPRPRTRRRLAILTAGRATPIAAPTPSTAATSRIPSAEACA